MYEALKPLGALSIAIGWVSMFLLIKKWPGNKSMSFSRHASANQTAYFTMAILESIFLPMYFVFISTWFQYTFNLPVAFTILNGISVVGLLLAAWIPDVADKRGKVHEVVAKTAYLCMIFASLFIALSDEIATFPRIFSASAFAYMIVASFYLLRHEKGQDNFLYFQASFLASIHLSVLIAAYIR